MEALELMKYFPFWPTFENLLQVLSHLFNLKFVVGLIIKRETLYCFQNVTESGVERCHPSVRIYSVADKSTGEHLGRLYIDPFTRKNKRGGWNTLLGRRKRFL